jgi:hypothetical protein
LEGTAYFAVLDNSTSRPPSVLQEYRAALNRLSGGLEANDCVMLAAIPANPRRMQFSDAECLSPPSSGDWVVQMFRDTVRTHIEQTLDEVLKSAERTEVTPLLEMFYSLERAIRAYEGMECEAWVFTDGLHDYGNVKLPRDLDTTDVADIVSELTAGVEVPDLQGCRMRIVATGGGDADRLTPQQEQKLARIWVLLIQAMNGRMDTQDYGPLIYARERPFAR